MLVSESVFVCVQEHELRIIEAGQDKKRFCTIANHKLPARIFTSTIQPDVSNNSKQFYTNRTTTYQSAHPGKRNRCNFHVSHITMDSRFMQLPPSRVITFKLNYTLNWKKKLKHVSAYFHLI